ncbi:MAG: hypothetical protein IIX36_07560 [Clostridia bacterium]|nr:hypothetical protein [Clostridia bacterium]
MTVCSKCGHEQENRVIYRIKTVKLKKSKVNYNGNYFLPELIITDSKGQPLEHYIDYTANLPYVRDIGKYKINIVFEYPYSGKTTVIFEITSPISKPKLLSASSTNNGVKITWESQKKAHGYIVYRKNGNEGWKRLGTTKNSYFIDQTAIYNKTYKYTVKAYYTPENGNNITSGYDKNGLSLKVTKVRTPAKPTVTSKSLYANIKINKVEGATKYEIYKATSKDGKYKLLYTTKKDALSYIDKNVKINKTYYYKIKAFTGSKASQPSAYSKVLIKLDTPKINKTVIATDSTITFTWNAVKGADFYRVYEKKDTKSSWTKIKTLNATNNPSYTAQFKSYRIFTVVAFKKISSSTVVMSSTADVLSTNPFIQPKINVQSVSPSSTEVLISSEVGNSATHYILYRKIGTNGSWKAVTNTPFAAHHNAPEPNREILKTGTTYYYKVRGLTNRGTHIIYGPYSKTVSVTLKYNPDVQVILSAKKTDGSTKFPVTIKNNGTKTLRIYSDAFMNHSQDGVSLNSGRIYSYIPDYVDIPAKSSATVYFMSDTGTNGKKIAYSPECVICFKFKYNGVEYYSSYSYVHGKSFYLNQ